MDGHMETDLENLPGFCDEAPEFYVSRTSRLTVVYSTGLDATSRGFKAEYETQGSEYVLLVSLIQILHIKSVFLTSASFN